MEDAAGVTVNDDLSTTVKLSRPIKTGKDGKETIASVTFPAEATVAHLEASDKGKGDIEKAARLMAELVGRSYADVRKMNANDFTRCAGVLNGLVGKDLDLGGIS
jgi:hypothetical protein